MRGKRVILPTSRYYKINHLLLSVILDKLVQRHQVFAQFIRWIRDSNEKLVKTGDEIGPRLSDSEVYVSFFKCLFIH